MKQHVPLPATSRSVINDTTDSMCSLLSFRHNSTNSGLNLALRRTKGPLQDEGQLATIVGNDSRQ